MYSYFIGNDKREATGFCTKCQVPLSMRASTIEGQFYCPFCADLLIRQYLETYGFGLALEKDFSTEKTENVSHYG
jgi:predicted RNA-binding Zn-ribbon protein involved in translation (DUF1610 family)